MAVTPTCLIEGKDAENAQTIQYTSPTGVTTIIDKFTATNHDSAAQTLSINLVPSGGSAAATNLITKLKTLQAGETYMFPEAINQVLLTGDFISTIASSASKITIRASGRVVS